MKLTLDQAQFRVEAHRVAMALPFQAKNDIRYYLNGVAIQPSKGGGVNVLATDGHAAICIHDIGGHAARPIILAIGPEHARYLKMGGHVLATGDGQAWITDVDGQVVWIAPTKQIDGTFPDLRAIVGPLEDYSEGLVGTFNPKLIDKLRKVYSGAKFKGVRFFHRTTKEGTAALVALNSDGFALVMPMRDDAGMAALDKCVPADFRRAA